MDNPISPEQFLSEAAHDIKQPLNVLQMYIGILQRRAKLDADDELLTVVKDATRNMQSMLSLLSNWARAEQQTLKAAPAPLSGSNWFTLFDDVEWASVTPAPSPENSNHEKSVDRELLLQTLQDMGQLLPAPLTLEVGNHPWQLKLTTPPLLHPNNGAEQLRYEDDLYQLAVTAGCTILQQLGFETTVNLSTEEEKGVIELHDAT